MNFLEMPKQSRLLSEEKDVECPIAISFTQLIKKDWLKEERDKALIYITEVINKYEINKATENDIDEAQSYWVGIEIAMKTGQIHNANHKNTQEEQDHKVLHAMQPVILRKMNEKVKELNHNIVTISNNMKALHYSILPTITTNASLMAYESTVQGQCLQKTQARIDMLEKRCFTLYCTIHSLTAQNAGIMHSLEAHKLEQNPIMQLDTNDHNNNDYYNDNNDSNNRNNNNNSNNNNDHNNDNNYNSNRKRKQTDDNLCSDCTSTSSSSSIQKSIDNIERKHLSMWRIIVIMKADMDTYQSNTNTILSTLKQSLDRLEERTL